MAIDRKTIVSLNKKGESNLTIAKELQIRRETVWKVVKKFRETGQTSNRPQEWHWTANGTSRTFWKVNCYHGPESTSREHLGPSSKARRPHMAQEWPNGGFRPTSRRSSARKTGPQLARFFIRESGQNVRCHKFGGPCILIGWLFSLIDGRKINIFVLSTLKHYYQESQCDKQRMYGYCYKYISS